MNPQTLSSNSMIPRPLFGRPANEATHNLSGAMSASTIATAHEKEIPVNRHSRSVALLFAVLALVFTFNVTSGAQVKRSLITEEIDQSRRITLTGNTRPEANAVNDRGAVQGAFPLNHIVLLLRRPAETEQSFRQYLDDLHDPATPTFHRWLTAAQQGQRFGPAQQDVNTIKAWLQSQGFVVNTIYDSGILIDFSGTAEQVSQAFHTEIHQLEVNGEHHIANMSDPEIPDALAPAIVGIVSLNDFMPHPMLVNVKPLARSAKAGPSPDYTNPGCLQGTSCYSVVPADLATIYNFPPHVTGQMGEGRTIALIENSDVYSRSDWQTFVNKFGLSAYHPVFQQVHPGPGCIDPGINGADGEATLDAEWATAAAPAAHIKLASCSDALIFGGFLALQNLLQETPTPDVVSISYGAAESDLGVAYNAYIDSLYQTAGGAGVSVYVAAGDSGAAGNDNHEPYAIYGINVSGFASTPDNVAVGGTDFEDTYRHNNRTYWNSSNDPLTYGSAKSYIPEIPWNDSCASSLLAKFWSNSTPLFFCNHLNSLGQQLFLNTQAGSGGPSGCATGSPSTPGVVSGNCAGYAKPWYQNGFLGVPSDGVRDLPDVSLFAANGVWSHFYVYCFSDPTPNRGGAPCTGAPSGWSGAGGTSFAAPIWAGIQALLNQKINSLSGNPVFVLYNLAKTDTNYGSGHCDSNSPAGPSSSCIFYDVTPTGLPSGVTSDMDVPCSSLSGTLHNCYQPGGATLGVLSTSNTVLQPAYGTATGWDFATGIGTVNVQNLINNWPPPPTPGCAYINGVWVCW